MNEFPCCKHCGDGCSISHAFPCVYGCNDHVEICQVCLNHVTMMVQKGSGYCSAKCQEESNA